MIAADGDAFPLAPVQEATLLQSVASPGSPVHVMQALVTLDEAIDPRALAGAWRDAAARHPMLRTAFRLQGVDEPVQRIAASPDFEWREEDATGLPAEARERWWDAWLDRDRLAAFDLAGGTPMRVTLVRFDDAHWRIAWTYHHALLDARSDREVLREVLDRYDALVAGRPYASTNLVPFRDYVAWLRTRDTSGERAYWHEALAGFDPSTSFATRGPAAPESHLRAGVDLCLSPEATAGIRRVASAAGASVSTLVMGAWAQILSRHGDRDDVAFGATVTLRGEALPAHRDIIGPLINTVPFRVRVDGDAPLRRWLARLRRDWLALRTHAWCGLTPIRAYAGLGGARALFDSFVAFDFHAHDAWFHRERPAWTTRRFAIRSTAAAPIVLSVYGEPQLSIRLAYQPASFEAAQIDALRGHLETLLLASADLDRPVRAQPMLTEGEARQLTGFERGPPRPRADDQNVVTLFARQAARTPDAIAVESGAEATRYRELDDASSRLAGVLRAEGVGRGALVAICLGRTPDLVVAILGTLKAGAAWVVLDPALPDARLAAIARDASPKALVTGGALAARLDGFDGPIVRLDGDRLSRAASHDPGVAVAPDDPAYVVYTSGSTGAPKGIVVGHGALANHTLALVERYGIGEGDRRLQFVSLGSDVLVAELFPALCAGAAVVMRPDGPAPPVAAFLRLIEERRVTIAGVPSAYWHEWADALERGEASIPPSLRIVVSGMDRVRPDRYEAWRRHARGRVRWFNAYGPSEATCTSTSHEADLASDGAVATVPIGRPLPNVRVRVLDRHRRPVPIGVQGEIVIGGAGVARGYLGQPGLTAERFVTDDDGARYYCTGDLGRWRSDGELVFDGRRDEQVKIRGWRVELAEVEAALRSLPGVRDAAAVAFEPDGAERRLVALLVPDGEGDRGIDVRTALAARLPEPMVPTAIALCEAIPRTPDGKVDRAALSRFVFASASGRGKAAPPADPLECMLVEMWEALLGRRVGTTDDFFDVGGDSLLAARMVDAVERGVGRRVSLASVASGLTIRRLAGAVVRGAGAGAPVVVVNAEGARPPLWFLHGDYNGGGFYCRPLSRAIGADQPFYALHPHGLDRSAVPETIEAMAEDLLPHLRRTQPHGPYFLGGYCAGAYVAFEMARRLDAAGEWVPLVVLIDARAPDAASTDPAKRWSLDAFPMGRAGLRGQAVDPVTARYRDVVSRYAPAPYGGRVAVLRSGVMARWTASLGWSRLAARVEAARIPGEHFTAITRHVDALGTIVRGCLDGALARDAAPAVSGRERPAGNRW